MVCLAAATAAWAQADITFRSNVPLVVVPVTVTDRDGKLVDGLNESDLLLYDNNVPQKLRLDELKAPISLALVVQTSFQPLLDKLRGLGGLIEPLITGHNGDAALITYRGDVSVDQPFTKDIDEVVLKLRMLQARGAGAASMDAVMQAVELLKEKPTDRRRVILLIGEASDRGSQTKMGEALFQVSQQNISVYALTFSRLLMPFTARPNADLPPGALVGEGGCQKPSEQLTPPAQKAPPIKPHPGEQVLEPQYGCDKADLLALAGELKRATSPRASNMLAGYTGGVADGVLRKRGLEDALERIGRDLHTQYVGTFTPPASAGLSFHTIRVEVRNRPGLVVRTRAGYWSIPR